VSDSGLRSTLDRLLHRQWQKRSTLAWLAAPLSLIFGVVVWLRRKWYAALASSRIADVHQVQVPIMVIGNIYIGGTGKTPIVISLVQQLKNLGWHPGVISRGYGVRIGPNPLTGVGALNARLFGDEPALIAMQTGVPVSVHPDRPKACRALLEHHPTVDLVIADDGLQHLALQRDIEIIVQDERGTGNGWLLPAGPLREPVTRLMRADAVITRSSGSPAQVSKQATLLAGDGQDARTPRRATAFVTITRFRRLHDNQIRNTNDFLVYAAEQTSTAIAGIATPARFFNGLTQLGLQVQQTLALPDHFSFETSPFAICKTDLIIITAKDAIKCHDIDDPRIWVAEIDLTFSDPDFLGWLDQRLRTIRTRLLSD